MRLAVSTIILIISLLALAQLLYSAGKSLSEQDDGAHYWMHEDRKNKP